jgi:hypothetical protein
MSTTPNDVKVNRKTIESAAAIDGPRMGSVVRRNAVSGEAPSERAASTTPLSSLDQTPPTVRTTTATLKKTCAARIPQMLSDSPSATNADPTTTVGSTNGTVTSARTRERPGNEKWDTTAVSGIATKKVSSVETVACHSVNQTTERVVGDVRTSANPPPNDIARMRATG